MDPGVRGECKLKSSIVCHRHPFKCHKGNKQHSKGVWLQFRYAGALHGEHIGRNEAEK